MSVIEDKWILVEYSRTPSKFFLYLTSLSTLTYLFPLGVFDDLVSVFGDELHGMFLEFRFVVIVTQNETTRNVLDCQIVNHLRLSDV